MGNSITREQKSWAYLIFFITGILSYPLGGFLLGLLSDKIINLQNALCELGQCGLDLGFAFGFVFPIVICSILFSIGLYIFKEQSLIFALKAFAISSIAASLILFGGLIYFHFLFWPLVFLSILLMIALITFKKQPYFNFALRAFSISFIALFLIITGLFMWAASTEVMQGIDKEEVNKSLNKYEYAKITETELREYPALKKAVDIEGRNRLEVNYTEWGLIKNFLDAKWRERSISFVTNENLENELNNRTVTTKIRNVFTSEGFTIPENSYIYWDPGRLLKIWYVTKRYNLFSIKDSEIEKELNNITKEDIVSTKLKNVFVSNGFSLPEDARVFREYGEWIINGTGYTILKEDGRLNVYTGDEKIYEVQKEDGKLRVVYVGPEISDVSHIFKVREKYYRFSFWVS